MSHVTLTTVVRNAQTLSMLLKYTDMLVERGLLNCLRIVDKTTTVVDDETIRSLLFAGGEAIKRRDPGAAHFEALEGYRHRVVEKSIVPGGDVVTIVTKGSVGTCIGLATLTKNSTNFEIVLDSEKCYARRGRGGGAIIASVPMKSLGGSQGVWRAYELEWTIDGSLKITNDLNESLCISNFGDGLFEELKITVSAPIVGRVDIIVSSLPLVDILCIDFFKKSYTKCYVSDPEPVVEGIEIVSSDDIVFIDVDGWASLLDNGVPLVIGDLRAFDVLKLGKLLIRAAKVRECHVSFLERSRRVMGCVDGLRKKSVLLASNIDDSVVKLLNGKQSGVPVLFSTMTTDLVFDQKLLDGYRNLMNTGFQGADLTADAVAALIHVDSIIDDVVGCNDFLAELVEKLPEVEKKYLLGLLFDESEYIRSNIVEEQVD